MGEMKPWQIILIVVALGVAGFSGFRALSGGGTPKGPDGYMTVDIETGQLYLVKKGRAKGVMFPVKHPDTGERTLYHVVQEEGSDIWELNPRFVSDIDPDLYKSSEVLVGGGKLNYLENDPISFVLLK